MDANENCLCGGQVISHTRRARFLCVVVMHWPHVVFGVLLNYPCPVTFGGLVETRSDSDDAFKIQRTRPGRRREDRLGTINSASQLPYN